MTPEELMRLFKFIFKAKGIKNTVFAPWSVFACPFWQNGQGTQVGFKLLACRSSRASVNSLPRSISVDASAVSALLRRAATEDR